MTAQLSNSVLDPNNLLAELRALENRVKLSQQMPNHLNPQNTFGFNSDYLANSINNLVEQKLSALGLIRKDPVQNPQQVTTTEQQTPVQTQVEQPLSPQAILEQKLNDFSAKILTKEQLQWISDPTIFSGIPLFLTSNKGKELITMMVDEYKSFLDR